MDEIFDIFNGDPFRTVSLTQAIETTADSLNLAVATGIMIYAATG